MKKKVLFVIDSLNCGGAEKSLVSLLSLLDKSKYDIYLWIRSRGGNLESCIPNHIKVLPAPKYNYLERIILSLSSILFSVVIRTNKKLGKIEHGAESLWKYKGRFMKGVSGTFDVAVAYQQGIPTYLVPTKIKAKKRIAWVNCDIASVGYSLSFNKNFYELYQVIVPVSKELETILNSYYPQFHHKFKCVYDILNPSLIKLQASESIQDYKADHDKTIIVTAGRLAAPKNYTLAVKTAKVLKEQGIHFIWLFVGEGSERAKLQQLIADYQLEGNVLILGYKENPYPYMANCDVYVQTSISEGFGLTIAEAKILGKPIVSTDFKVVHDQLTHGENGLVASMNPESVASNILLMIENEELRNKIINNLGKEDNDTYHKEVIKVEHLLDED